MRLFSAVHGTYYCKVFCPLCGRVALLVHVEGTRDWQCTLEPTCEHLKVKQCDGSLNIHLKPKITITLDERR